MMKVRFTVTSCKTVYLRNLSYICHELSESHAGCWIYGCFIHLIFIEQSRAGSSLLPRASAPVKLIQSFSTYYVDSGQKSHK